MSIDEEDKVDLVTVDPTTGQTKLYILDANELNEDRDLEHLYKIQEKINLYTAAIESDEIVAKFPKSRREAISIIYACPKSPPAWTDFFFARCKDYLLSIDINFCIEFENFDKTN